MHGQRNIKIYWGVGPSSGVTKTLDTPYFGFLFYFPAASSGHNQSQQSVCRQQSSSRSYHL